MIVMIDHKLIFGVGFNVIISTQEPSAGPVSVVDSAFSLGFESSQVPPSQAPFGKELLILFIICSL